MYFMSEIKQDNNQPSKYQELNDCELEVVCGGTAICVKDTDASDFVPESASFTKSEAA